MNLDTRLALLERLAARDARIKELEARVAELQARDNEFADLSDEEIFERLEVVNRKLADIRQYHAEYGECRSRPA